MRELNDLQGFDGLNEFSGSSRRVVGRQVPKTKIAEGEGVGSLSFRIKRDNANLGAIPVVFGLAALMNEEYRTLISSTANATLKNIQYGQNIVNGATLAATDNQAASALTKYTHSTDAGTDTVDIEGIQINPNTFQKMLGAGQTVEVQKIRIALTQSSQTGQFSEKVLPSTLNIFGTEGSTSIVPSTFRNEYDQNTLIVTIDLPKPVRLSATSGLIMNVAAIASLDFTVTFTVSQLAG